jgi:glycosyltransferase involved in cell wall biosynthesis
MKVALISHKLPPSSSGQSMMIHRMLRDVSPDRYCLISSERHEPNNHSSRLPGKYYHLPPTTRINRGYRFGLRYLREGINIPIAVAQQANRITEIIRQERCEAVVACTGELTHMPAGYLASRRTGVPFYAYVFDHYSYREWHDPAAAFWARRFEPLLMKRAKAVITPNETLREDLRERFGIEAAVIHNSLDISPYEVNGQPPRDLHENGIKIVYTGDVYEAHYDAFKNLMIAIESLGRPEIKLHIYSDRPLEHFASYGIRGPLVRHPHQSADEMPRVQMEADVLFLPLAFNSPYPDLVRTSATTKLGEYLAARRPTIVHAPPDSFLVTYFRRHECGVVVDRLDPSLLAREITRVLDDVGLRERLAARAWEQARRDFDISAARRTFWNLVKGAAQSPST